MQCTLKHSTLPSNYSKLNPFLPNGYDPENLRSLPHATTWIPAKWRCFPFDPDEKVGWFFFPEVEGQGERHLCQFGWMRVSDAGDYTRTFAPYSSIPLIVVRLAFGSVAQMNL